MRVPEFIRFLSIGAANTAISYALYAFFLMIGLTYIYSSFLALVVGILVSFKTQGAFVFNNVDNTRIFRFGACWAVIYIVNIAAVTVFLRWGANAYVAGAAALPFIAIFSYFVQKRFVFAVVDHPR